MQGDNGLEKPSGRMAMLLLSKRYPPNRIGPCANSAIQTHALKCQTRQKPLLMSLKLQKLAKFRRFLRTRTAETASEIAGVTTEKYYEFNSNTRTLVARAALLCSLLTCEVVLLDANDLAMCPGIVGAVHLSRNGAGQLLVIGAASPTQGQTATQQQSEEK